MNGLHIRWMIRRDMPEVLEIENKSYETPWSEEEFIRCLRQRNVIGMVAEWNDKVIGHMVYALHSKTIELLNIAVEPDYRRSMIGTLMIDKLVCKLHTQRRNRISAIVSDENLGAQLFFRDVGFTGSVNDESSYKFVYRLRERVEA